MRVVRGRKDLVRAVAAWVKDRSPKVKAALGVIAGVFAMIFLWSVVHNHENLYLAAAASHAMGLAVLAYKLIRERTCAGISLKSQELTALYLAVDICSFAFQTGLHTLLDSARLVTTLWVVYMIRFKLRSGYMKDKDTLPIYYVVIPCALLALFIHPAVTSYLRRILFAFGIYLEALSVLPQLRMMQNAKIIEPFTAQYVFALGVARFLSCAFWVLQVFHPRGRRLLFGIFYYGLWPRMLILSEIVQTFILADFCYYYMKSVVAGDPVLRLPTGVV